jgi:hypothetical protein
VCVWVGGLVRGGAQPGRGGGGHSCGPQCRWVGRGWVGVGLEEGEGVGCVFGGRVWDRVGGLGRREGAEGGWWGGERGEGWWWGGLGEEAEVHGRSSCRCCGREHLAGLRHARLEPLQVPARAGTGSQAVSRNRLKGTSACRARRRHAGTPAQRPCLHPRRPPARPPARARGGAGCVCRTAAVTARRSPARTRALACFRPGRRRASPLAQQGLGLPRFDPSNPHPWKIGPALLLLAFVAW